MKEIKLSQGKVALVDDEDYDFLMQWKWFAYKAGNSFYVARNETDGMSNRKLIMMHRIIMDTPAGLVVDHIFGNGLDNRKSKMRNCTHAENIRNSRISKNNTSGTAGVHWDVREGKWKVQIGINGKRKHIGYFTDKADAILAYNEAAKKYHGEFANLNRTAL